MGFPNYLDNTFYNVVLTGGNWLKPLINLKNPRLSLPARSNSASNADTKFEVDLGSIRDISLFAIPSTNASLSGQYRLQATETPVFSNSTVVGGSVSIGATSISFKAPSGVALSIPAGTFFTVGGYLYKTASLVSISAGATGSVSLASASGNDIHYGTAQTAMVLNDPITCNSGDYTTPKYDSGTKDIFNRIYAWGSLPWQHPSFWTGLPTLEDRLENVFPVVDVLIDNVILARYFKFEFFDSSNTDGFFAISRLFLTPGWQPSINPIYGASFGYVSTTAYDTSLGGEDAFDIREGRRELAFTIEHLPENEALSQALEMQRKQDIHKQMFFIFMPEDTENMHRRAFTATLSSLDPLGYSYYNAMTFSAKLREVIGGILT